MMCENCDGNKGCRKVVVGISIIKTTKTNITSCVCLLFSLSQLFSSLFSSLVSHFLLDHHHHYLLALLTIAVKKKIEVNNYIGMDLEWD